MSKRIRKFERGTADLITIAFGLIIVAIAAIGTSYSLLYGRQALIHQEHYKTALYKLRGFMEEHSARMRFSTASPGGYASDDSWKYQRQEQSVPLESSFDREGQMVGTTARLWREPLGLGDDPQTSNYPDYYILTAYVEWKEPSIAGEMSGSRREMEGPTRRIKMVSDIFIPN